MPRPPTCTVMDAPPLAVPAGLLLTKSDLKSLGLLMTKWDLESTFNLQLPGAPDEYLCSCVNFAIIQKSWDEHGNVPFDLDLCPPVIQESRMEEFSDMMHLMSSKGIVATMKNKDDFLIEETNMAGIGSPEDRALRKQCAMTEPAWTVLPDSEPGVWIWRIEEFKVVPWPENLYGKFYENDSYIILHSEEIFDEETEAVVVARNIYYWLGKTTSIDEKGTAALKVIELDDFYDGACNHHREKQENESGDFEDLMNTTSNGFFYLAGGVESGFNPLIPDVYRTKLLIVRKKRTGCWAACEVPCEMSSFAHSDSYIIDAGQNIWVWCGKKSAAFAKAKAGLIAHEISEGRQGVQKVHFHENGLWEIFGGLGEIAETFPEGELNRPFDPILYKIDVDDQFQMNVEQVAQGTFNRGMLDTNSVMMVWTNEEIFIWVGEHTKGVEKRNPLRYAQRYLTINTLPQDTPVSVLREGNKHQNNDFEMLFGGGSSRGNGGMCGTGSVRRRRKE